MIMNSMNVQSSTLMSRAYFFINISYYDRNLPSWCRIITLQNKTSLKFDSFVLLISNINRKIVADITYK